jgi:hypothetical protein
VKPIFGVTWWWVADLAVLDVPARLNDFKPIHISNGLVRFRYSGGNRIPMLVSDEPTSYTTL